MNFMLFIFFFFRFVSRHKGVGTVGRAEGVVVETHTNKKHVLFWNLKQEITSKRVIPICRYFVLSIKNDVIFLIKL